MCRVVKKTQSQLISIILNTSNRVEGSPSLTCLYRERDINTREARSTHRSRCCGGCTGRTRGRGCCGIDNNNGIGGKGNGGGETIELDSLLLRLPSEINCISRPRRRRRFTGGSQFHLNSLSEKGIFFYLVFIFWLYLFIYSVYICYACVVSSVVPDAIYSLVSEFTLHRFNESARHYAAHNAINAARGPTKEKMYYYYYWERGEHLYVRASGCRGRCVYVYTANTEGTHVNTGNDVVWWW